MCLNFIVIPKEVLDTLSKFPVLFYVNFLTVFTFFHISKVYFQSRAHMCNILFIVLNILEIKITNEDSDQSQNV